MKGHPSSRTTRRPMTMRTGKSTTIRIPAPSRSMHRLTERCRCGFLAFPGCLRPGQLSNSRSEANIKAYPKRCGNDWAQKIRGRMGDPSPGKSPGYLRHARGYFVEPKNIPCRLRRFDADHSK